MKSLNRVSPEVRTRRSRCGEPPVYNVRSTRSSSIALQFPFKQQTERRQTASQEGHYKREESSYSMLISPDCTCCTMVRAAAASSCREVYGKQMLRQALENKNRSELQERKKERGGGGGYLWLCLVASASCVISSLSLGDSKDSSPSTAILIPSLSSSSLAQH